MLRPRRGANTSSAAVATCANSNKVASKKQPPVYARRPKCSSACARSYTGGLTSLRQLVSEKFHFLKVRNSSAEPRKIGAPA